MSRPVENRRGNRTRNVSGGSGSLKACKKFSVAAHHPRFPFSPGMCRWRPEEIMLSQPPGAWRTWWTRSSPERRLETVKGFTQARWIPEMGTRRTQDPRTSHPASYHLCLRLRLHQAPVSTGKLQQPQTAAPPENLRVTLRVREKTPTMGGTPVTRTGAASGSTCSC